jgi:plastocyanin
MRKIFVSLAAIAVLAGGACGGDKKESSTQTTSGKAAAVTIKAEGTTWNPGDVTVKPGDVVEWNVAGSIVHDLRGDDDVSHKAGSQFTYRHTYSKAGTYSFQCSIHPKMVGTVTVSA